MCGLVGTFNLPRNQFDVAARLEAIAHRGPDGSGVREVDGAVHGHVRLALLDLTDGSAQPYESAGGGILSFNGEIWNWRELAREAGVPDARSDTQVLAAMLDALGVERALSALDGMFAFAWTDASGTWLARDRFGKIPLHVWRSGARWAWASELKALGGLPSAPLPPGSVVNLTTGEVTRWYSPRAAAERLVGTPEPDRVAVVADGLARGVSRRLVADAPLCCLVSGGLDSSLILSIAKQMKPDVVAYTAVLDEASADLKAARRMCREIDVDLVEVKIREPSAADLSAVVRAIELDMKAQVEIAALCVPLARAIASDGFKACLSGEAADELFGGYGSMCIKGSSATDGEWREIRLGQLEKMSRGNFVRCNKAFMAAGVECRLPFMERGLVERVLAMGKAECPPAKRLLKASALARDMVPAWVAKRPKDTFQGASGMADAAARAVADPARFYRAELRSAFGPEALAA